MRDDEERETVLAIVAIVTATVVLVVKGFDWSNQTALFLPLPLVLIMMYLGAAVLLVRIVVRRRREDG